jgi:hypothetical protein
MKTSYYVVLAAVLGAAALMTPRAHAQTVNTTLDQFLPGGANAGGLTIGDKRYSNFTFSSSGDGPVTAANVDVSLVGTDTQHQIRFTFSRDLLDAPAGQTTDVVICYQVDVLGNQLINGVGLAFNSSVTGGTPGSAAASVIETVSTTDGSDLVPGAPVSDEAILTVFNDGTGGGSDTPSATMNVNLTRSLLFCKDILVSSRPEGGRVVISTVDNFVTQVPEPTSLATLGAAGLLLGRRRRA